MTTRKRRRPAAVYRLWAADGALLYVGSAYVPEKRCKAHRDTPWWPSVSSRTEEWHSKRHQAYDAEATAIAQEQPRFNKVNTGSWSPELTPAQRDRHAGARRRGAVQARAAQLGRELSAMLQAEGVDHRTARSARQLLELAHLEASGLFDRQVTAKRRMLRQG